MSTLRDGCPDNRLTCLPGGVDNWRTDLPVLCLKVEDSGRDACHDHKTDTVALSPGPRSLRLLPW